MKKFNPDEFNSFQTNRSNSSTINNVFVPVLIVACSCLAMIGVTFSAKLVETDTEYHDIRIDIINGEEEVYTNKVTTGAFRDVINSKNSYGSISCTQGSLDFDPLTNAVSSTYINQDTYCVLVFMDDGVKNINIDNLTAINDNSGISYYYKADSQNNYIRVNNMLFRIIRVNGDGTLRIMLNDVVLTSTFGNENYKSSTLRNTLNNWYKTNFTGVDYVVAGQFDASNYEDNYDITNLIDLNGYRTDNVGTLSVREATIMSEDLTNYNFLNTVYGFYLMNASGHSNAYYYKDGKVGVTGYNNVLSVRPVININANELVGDGTYNNPYTIE